MKRLRNKWFLPLFCAALLATGGCSEDETESSSREPLPPTITTENIPDQGFSFLYTAQEPQTFLLSSDAPWEITKTEGWFVVTPKEGEAGTGLEISVIANENTGEERTGEFTIRANSGNHRDDGPAASGRLQRRRTYRRGDNRRPDGLHGRRVGSDDVLRNGLLRLDHHPERRLVGERLADAGHGSGAHGRPRDPDAQHRPPAPRGHDDHHRCRPGTLGEHRDA